MVRVVARVVVLAALFYSMSSLAARVAPPDAVGDICCSDDGGCPSDMYCAADSVPCDVSAPGYCRPRAAAHEGDER